MSGFSDREDIRDIAKLRRARQLAFATIKRGRDAGIPDKYLRVPQDKFAEALNREFHGGANGVQSLSGSIYNDPDFLLHREFIAIDGGDSEARTFAGCAILFRMIAYDKIGKFWDCNALGHKFQSINATSEITRNDLAEELKSYDVLFLADVRKKDFGPHFESGSFVDEVLSDRIYSEKPTIVAFYNPIASSKPSVKEMEKRAAEGALESGYGDRLAYVTLTPQTTKTILRVRVDPRPMEI